MDVGNDAKMNNNQKPNLWERMKIGGAMPRFCGLAMARWPQLRGGAAWFQDMTLSLVGFSVLSPKLWWNGLWSLASTDWFVGICS